MTPQKDRASTIISQGMSSVMRSPKGSQYGGSLRQRAMSVTGPKGESKVTVLESKLQALPCSKFFENDDNFVTMENQ